MIFTKRSDYGLRAILELARLDRSESLSASAIAERHGLPVAFVRKILQVLCRAGYITSEVGQQGGYSLARSAREISVLGLLEALEGDLAPVSCLGLEDDCRFSETCTTQEAWRHINSVLRDSLENVSVQDLANLTREKVV